MFHRITGLLLAAASMAAMVYCLRVASAQVAYCRLKFGDPEAIGSADCRSRLAAAAEQRYPHNYYLSMLMVDECWNRQQAGGEDPEGTQDAASADYWCRRGVAQNPYRRELRWMEALLAMRASPLLAVSRWRDYVDFAFWDAWTIASLVVLSAEAGRIEDALDLLPLLQGTPQHARASTAVEEAWRRERRMPPPGVSQSPDKR